MEGKTQPELGKESHRCKGQRGGTSRATGQQSGWQKGAQKGAPAPGLRIAASVRSLFLRLSFQTRGALSPTVGLLLHVRAEGGSSFIQKWSCLFLPHSQLAGTAANNQRHRWVWSQTMEVLRMEVLNPIGLHTSILSWHGLPSYAGDEGPILVFCGCQNK